ncbi:unnamed protein product [Dovyalis caffra]|uniref:Uncharacterized protein n=1 Tax=Dovyalis caffra TaxID=77055 RepID=A0AAV1R8S5_9ROSI|nr:unnamed protein product [Dovyalis caffra]
MVKCKKNKVDGLKDALRKWILETRNLLKLLTNYYKTLFTVVPLSMSAYSHGAFNLFTQRHPSILTALLLDMEIKVS